MKRQTLETAIAGFLPLDGITFDVHAFELWRDGDSWTVNDIGALLPVWTAKAFWRPPEAAGKSSNITTQKGLVCAISTISAMSLTAYRSNVITSPFWKSSRPNSRQQINSLTSRVNMKRNEIARWEARGKSFLSLTKSERPNGGYTYIGDGCGGGFNADTDAEAVAYLERPWSHPNGAGAVTILQSDRPTLKRVL
jgi:hypothetical protein